MVPVRNAGKEDKLRVRRRGRPFREDGEIAKEGSMAKGPGMGLGRDGRRFAEHSWIGGMG